MIRPPRTHAPRLLPALSLILGALAPAAFAQKVHGVGDQPAPHAAKASPGAVLLIDGVEVPAEAYAKWLIEEIGPTMLKEFSVGWVLEQQAQARGLAADEPQIEAALDEEIQVRVDNAFRGKREEWVGELARLGRSVDGHRLQRKTELGDLLNARNIAAEGRVVPEEKIQRDWELFHGPRGRVFELDMLKIQVVVHMPDGNPSPEDYERLRTEARTAGLQRALQARERLLQGEDFGELVREIGEDEKLRETGGHVPRFSQYGWPSGFVDELFTLERNGISEPLFARGGWWIVKVRSWKDTPLESVREELTRRLIERGPEQDEIGNVYDAVAKSVRYEIQPGMYVSDAPGGGELPDPTALLVDGQPVSRKTLARWLLHVRGETAWTQYSEEWLLERKAKALGLSVTEEEIDADVQRWFQLILDEGYKGDRGLWKSYMDMQGLDSDAFMEQLRRRRRVVLLAEKCILTERPVTPEMVKATFQARYGATGRRVQARVILLEVPTPKFEKGLSKAEVEALMEDASQARRRDAQALAERARAGEDFATLARQNSDDRISRELGGELEGGFRPDGWSSNVSTVVMGLPRGTISEPLQEGRFWAVFEIKDFETVDFESVRKEIEETLRARRPEDIEVAAYRNELLKPVEVELLPGLRQ
jgi:parvulin-like peptidyl-prolyl isomerase